MKEIFKHMLVALVVSVAFASAGLAGDVLLRCELQRHGAYQGTPTELIVAYEQGEKRMVVYDNLMKFYEKDPVWARVDRETDRTLVLRWKLDDLRTSSGQVMDWRFTLNWSKATGRANISGRAAVSDDANVGSGTCKLVRK